MDLFLTVCTKNEGVTTHFASCVLVRLLFPQATFLAATAPQKKRALVARAARKRGYTMRRGRVHDPALVRRWQPREEHFSAVGYRSRCANRLAKPASSSSLRRGGPSSGPVRTLRVALASSCATPRCASAALRRHRPRRGPSPPTAVSARSHRPAWSDLQRVWCCLLHSPPPPSAALSPA